MTSLRRHYLDQVHGSSALRAKLSAFVAHGRPFGSPNGFKLGRFGRKRQAPAERISQLPKNDEPKLAKISTAL